MPVECKKSAIKIMILVFLEKKSEILNSFNNFVAMIEKQTNKEVKSIRSDNGRAYFLKES
jgi:hypothetical protein